MDEKLAPALKYLMWVDTKNHIEMTRPWFGSHLPFPLGLYYPNKFEGEAVQLVESLHGHDQLDIGPGRYFEKQQIGFVQAMKYNKYKYK
jgi:hypothetical protein